MKKATLDDVKAFFATWYVPNNASLVVAGDFDPAVVKPMIENYFGRLPSRTLPGRVKPPVPTRPVKPGATVTDQVSEPQVSWFWHAPERFSAGDAEF